MKVKIKQMTRILKADTKLIKLSKRARNAEDVEHITMFQDVGPERLVVILVIKRVTYPHAVKMSKNSEKQPKPEKGGKSTGKGKCKGKGKGDHQENQADRSQACEQCGKIHQSVQSCKKLNSAESRIEKKMALAMNMIVT